MNVLNNLKLPERSLKRRLIRYMLILIAVILTALLSALALVGGFNSDRRELVNSLNLQLDFMENEFSFRSTTLSAIGVDLSNTTASLLDTELQRRNCSLSDLEGDTAALSHIQELLISPLRDFLLRSESSGAFILLNSTVYTQHDPGSHCGLYLQKKGTSSADPALLLYRGKADIAKALGIMPHRKWRLEFQSNLFSNFNPHSLTEKTPAEWAYTYSPVLSLPGTSEQALLLQVPIRGSDGTLYGICGFELNQSFFKTHYPQPSRLNHLSFLISTQTEGADIPENRLTSGTAAGFFSSPTGTLEHRYLRPPLSKFIGENRSYVGIGRKLDLGPNNPSSFLNVLMPLEDYHHIIYSSLIQTILLAAVLLVFAVLCCVLFAQRFLLPILRSLEQVKKGSMDYDSGLQEIDDLFSFLAEQGEHYQTTLQTLQNEMNDVQGKTARILQEYEQMYRSAQKEVSRLADLQLKGADSPAYQEFLNGIQQLTPTETMIFHYYLEGKTIKEIMAITQTKESTLRYHNHNIYGKLGVKSLKQLLQFATIMRSEEQNKDP